MRLSFISVVSEEIQNVLDLKVKSGTVYYAILTNARDVEIETMNRKVARPSLHKIVTRNEIASACTSVDQNVNQIFLRHIRIQRNPTTNVCKIVFVLGAVFLMCHRVFDHCAHAFAEHRNLFENRLVAVRPIVNHDTDNEKRFCAMIVNLDKYIGIHFLQTIANTVQSKYSQCAIVDILKYNFQFLRIFYFHFEMQIRLGFPGIQYS